LSDVQRGWAVAAPLAVAGVTSLVFWPGGLLRAGHLKVFAYYAYLLARGEEWSQAPLLAASISKALLPMLVFAPAVVLWLAIGTW
jgi:hypothetical protein